MPDDVGLPVSDTGRKPHFLQNLTAAIYFNPCDVASDLREESEPRDWLSGV